MKKTYLFSLIAISILLFNTTACTTDSGFTMPEPTFDSVPEPLDISGVEAESVQDGTVKYIIEEGYGEDRVVIRDDLLVFITLRNMDGDYIYSSYQNDRTSPNIITVLNVVPRLSQNYNVERSFTNGLRKGLIGMREGENRVLIVPPEEGFANIQSGGLTEAFRNDTLRYDIELDAIL
ncbi:hypothetical protein BH23BAC3_BH23BAC3_16440 [soil metagenome]